MEHKKNERSISATKTTSCSEVLVSQFWRTPLYQINGRGLSNDTTSDTTDDLPGKEQVKVPKSGLYGFVFGTKKHGEDFESVKQHHRLDEVKKENNDLAQHCGCTFRATFSIERPDQSIYSDSVLIPLTSPTSKHRLLTSTRVGKSFYLPKGTKINIECLTSCDNGNSCEWGWRIVLQKKYEIEQSEPFQPSKRARKNEDISNHKSDESKIQSEPFDYQKINFAPIQSSKKPVLCTKCCRKFPNCKAVRNHYISGHAPKVGDDSNESDDDYSDLVGPKVFRTPLDTAYEDDDVVVVVKPQGVPVQGSKWTLPKSDLLMQFRSKLNRKGDLTKPRVTHRLDGATGGLLVVAKSAEAERNMKKNFMNRLCKKRYRAIVFGKVIQNQHKYSDLPVGEDDCDDDIYSGMGVINVALGGKDSITRYRVVKYTICDHPLAQGFITTVDLFPLTGRRHQLRRHLRLIGHPIWGDFRYAAYSKTDRISSKDSDNDLDCNCSEEDMRYKSSDKNPHSQMCLWALEISFPHPCKDETVHASIDEPLWYEELRAALSATNNKTVSA